MQNKTLTEKNTILKFLKNSVERYSLTLNFGDDFALEGLENDINYVQTDLEIEDDLILDIIKNEKNEEFKNIIKSLLGAL